jgi:hypothetical protein
LEPIGQVRLETMDRLGQPGELGDEDGDALPLTFEMTRFARMVPELCSGGAGDRLLYEGARPRDRRCSAIELSTPLRGEREGFGQTTCRLPLGPAYGALEVLDGSQANPRPLGEGSLGEPGV